MWIEDKEGNLYNLDFACAIKLKQNGEQDKTWHVEAVVKLGEMSNVTLLSTDNEEKAREFFAKIKVGFRL